MDAFTLCLLLTAFACGMLAITALGVFHGRSRWSVLVLGAILVSLIAICYVGATIQGGQSFDRSLWQLLIEGKPKTLIVSLAGLISGVGWGAVAVMAEHGSKNAIVSLITTIATLTVVATGLVLAWDDEFDIESFRPAVLDDAYVIEELTRTEQIPVRLAWNEEASTLYFSTYSTGTNGSYGGSIFSIRVSSVVPQSVPALVASSPALYRTFGMTFHDGNLFVSRAGHAAQASYGNIIYANMGAVTQLKDLDGDGQFEYFDDVIGGIPAARGPDTMHQNNGITFDRAGNLFVAVGSADDRSVDQHPWSGTVLKLSHGENQPEVFARGLRNPFGICCGPAESVFVTDNDCAEDPGDEVNFVIAGGHYGHPYAIPRENRVSGFTNPILVGANSNYCGITYVPSDDSSEKSGSLFVCDRLKNSIVRLKVRFLGDTCTIIENELFAKVPAPVDVVASTSGDLFVASLSKQKIYRIRSK